MSGCVMVIASAKILADSEHKFHKTGIENWLPVVFSLGFS